MFPVNKNLGKSSTNSFVTFIIADHENHSSLDRTEFDGLIYYFLGSALHNQNLWKLRHLDDSGNIPGRYSVSGDCYVCEVLDMSRIVKYDRGLPDNIFLTLDQSFAILRERRLNILDIRSVEDCE